MAQQYPDKDYIISLLKTHLHFKSNDTRYNLNKRINKNDMTDITTQIAHLYAISTKANNNITIINNMNKDDNNNNNNEDVSEINLLKKEIEELKKENEELKKENNELKCRKYPESSDEEDDKISKKKYDREKELKNKYWKESKEKDNTIEKLQNEIKDIKEQHNIKIDDKPLDVCNDEFSDDEEDDDEDDIDPYEKIKQTEQQNKEKEEQEKQEEENKKNILQYNLDKYRTELKTAEDENNDKEVKKINKKICKIQKELNKL